MRAEPPRLAVPRNPSDDTAGPALGTTWDPSLAPAVGEIPSPPYLLFFGSSSIDLPGVGLPPSDVLLVSPLGFLQVFFFDTRPMALPTPSDCSLPGLKLYAQGGYNRRLPTPGGLSLTAGLEIDIGNQGRDGARAIHAPHPAGRLPLALQFRPDGGA